MEETIIEERTSEEINNEVVENTQEEKKSRGNAGNAGKVGVAAAAAGGAVFGGAAGVAGTAVAADIVEPDDISEPGQNQPEPEATADGSAWDGTLEVSHTNFDNMSFNDAFAAARAEVGPGGMFMYHGRPYNTFYAEELASLSDAERTDYQQQVIHAVNDLEFQHVSEETDTNDHVGGVTQTTPAAEDTAHAGFVSQNAGVEVPVDFSSISDDDIEIIDVDNDGSPDILGIDTNGDGESDIAMIDVDGDGGIDVVMDSNGDGILEVYHNVDDYGNAESMELVDINEETPEVDLETNAEFASLDDSFLEVDNDMNMTDYV